MSEPSRWWLVCAALFVLQGCGGGDNAADPATPAAAATVGASGPAGAASGIPVAAVAASAAASAATGSTEPTAMSATLASGRQSVASNFELVGGWRLQTEFASEGLALVSDADGFVVEAIGGANSHDGKLNVYDVSGASGAMGSGSGGADAGGYPVLQPKRQWNIADLFPNLMARQNLRDVTATRTPAGYELAGIGRVYYNTAPRDFTRIELRELTNGGGTLGATRQIAVDLPEQAFSGFIKHADSRIDTTEIGAGAYDSGQGSVGGLSYARQQPGGSWQRLLTPPGFGDVTSPRLPRDADYSCPGGTSWVCIEPKNGQGVWSTERIGGGGVKYDDNLLFIPMLGHGERTYARQSYTFGDAGLDTAVAYFFKENAATGAVEFQGYDRWLHAAAGEPVIGVALGRLRPSNDLLLFVVKSMAWKAGIYRDGSVLQVFRIKAG